MLEKNRMEEPRNSVVQITFGERNGTYSYYNDQFDLHRGDFVFVEGEFEGMIGCVLDVHYNFKAKRSVFKRVVSRINVEQLDQPLLGGEHLLFFDRKVLNPEKAALILGVRQDDDDEDYYIGSGDPAFSLDNMDGLKLNIQDARYGFRRYLDGEVVFLSLDGTRGTAMFSSTYGSGTMVEFEYSEGMIQNISCSCFGHFNCCHEFAAMLQLRETLLEIERDHKEEYDETGYFAAIQKEALVDVLGKVKKKMKTS